MEERRQGPLMAVQSRHVVPFGDPRNSLQILWFMSVGRTRPRLMGQNAVLSRESNSSEPADTLH